MCLVDSFARARLTVRSSSSEPIALFGVLCSVAGEISSMG